MEPIVDVVIPTYKPQQKYFDLLRMLAEQTVAVNRIIVMNTEEKYYEALTYGNKAVKRYRNVEVYHISKREFDHGNTRNKAVRKSKAPYFVCITQDAVPADEHLIENLIRPLGREDVAVSYGRQLPEADCMPIERFTREFNYPEESCIKGRDDIDRLGIKTFFCSNACAAYKRDVFEERGGFIRHTIFNEDMIYAAGVVLAGWKIAYAADAQVYHSHNYSWKEYFHRNVDLGESQADHPEIFAQIKSESEGIRLVKMTAQWLKENGYGNQIPLLIWNSGWKYLGYQIGKHYQKLPRGLVRKCSMNRSYFRG